MEILINFLKVLLSTQVIFGSIILYFLITYKLNIKSMLRGVSKIKLPGGTELTTLQIQKEFEEPIKDFKIPDNINSKIYTSKKEDIIKLYSQERSRAYTWEYMYLNQYFVKNTQYILD